MRLLTVVQLFINQAPGLLKRLQEAQGGTRKHQEAQDPEVPRRPPGSPRRPQDGPGNPTRPKEALGNPRRPQERASDLRVGGGPVEVNGGPRGQEIPARWSAEGSSVLHALLVVVSRLNCNTPFPATVEGIN